MSFTIQAIEKITLGDRELTPVLNTETKMRLRTASFKTAADEEAADEILASVFPNDKEYVLSTLRNGNVPLLEKEMLQLYLVGGQKAVDASLRGFERGFNAEA